MKNFFNNKKVNEFSLDNIKSECIPYACHYDENSLLTKNGELIQVISVEGLSKELTKNYNEDIRSIIRRAVLDNIPDYSISVYFHTIRTKHNLDSINYFSWTFARDTHDGWARKNHWRDKYVNELYITIIHQGEDYNDKDYILSSISPKALKAKYLSKLELNAARLNKIVLKILEILAPFGGKRLSVAHDHLGSHSQLLQFLSKIVSLRAKRMPLPVCGLDKIFCQTKIAFGGNILEVVDKNEKTYAAVFSIKEYHEVDLRVIDKFLRVSSEFVITQALNFVSRSEAQKEYKYSDYILSISKDTKLRNYSGIAEIMERNKGKPTDFALQQTNITFIAESQEILNNSIQVAMKELRKLGIVVVREDLNIELCFWAQLPGNFTFFRRQSYISTANVAGFASLHNTPSGSNESIWGACLSIFRKENGAPHFFNLHVKNNGHTFIAGPADSARSLLVNFLLSEASKYEPTVLYIDQSHSSQVAIKALGGRYENLNLDQNKPVFAFNPFSLKGTKQNKIFLKNWLYILLFNDNSGKKFENEISEAVESLYTRTNRNFSELLAIIKNEDLKEKIKPWCRNGQNMSIFDNVFDDFDSGIKINGLNIENILAKEKDSNVSTAIILYSIHKFIETITEGPSILIVNDANLLLENEIFGILLSFYLEALKNKNGIAIFLFNTDVKINKNISSNLKSFATNIYFPDPNAHLYQNDFNLSDETVHRIKHMKFIYRHIMFKQGKEEIVAELNLDGLDYTIQTLQGKNNAIEAMNKAIEETGDNPNRWIIPYYKYLLPELN